MEWNEKELLNTVEALLFVAGDPVDIERLSEILEINIGEITAVMDKLLAKYNRTSRGIKMVRLNDSYQLTTESKYFDYIVKLVTSKHKQSLSAANLEVLSIISYNQPITKAAIEQVRGVDSSYSIAKLLERDLIAQRGRLDAPGRPILYVTTDEFLRCFGLTSLEDMPELEEAELENISFDSLESADNVTFEELNDENED